MRGGKGGRAKPPATKSPAAGAKRRQGPRACTRSGFAVRVVFCSIEGRGVEGGGLGRVSVSAEVRRWQKAWGQGYVLLPWFDRRGRLGAGVGAAYGLE